MKTLLIISVLLLNAAISSAQTRQEVKLKKLWAKDPEKCIDKAERYIQRQKAQGPAYYYIALYRVEKAQSRQKASYWKRAMRAYEKAAVHTFTLTDSLGVHLDTLVNKWSRNANATEIKSIAQQYSKTFEDTLNAYSFLLTKEIEEAEEESHKQALRGLDSLREALLTGALQLKGIPYKWAGEDTNGFDCSGFTKYVYGTVGIELPHNAQMQALLDQGKEQTFEEAQPGDLLFFGSRNGNQIRVVHAAILFEKEPDSTKVIHCVSGGVSIDGDNSSWEHHWKDRVLFSRSLLVVEN